MKTDSAISYRLKAARRASKNWPKLRAVAERRIKKTFREYGEWWLTNCAKGNMKDSTYQEYERALKAHLYPGFGQKLIAKIKSADVREFVTNNNERC
jgi:hypothetical protein